MLLDAFKAETYRLAKNRSTLFWAIGFVPLALILGGTSIAWYVINKSKSLETNLSAVEKAGSADLTAPFMTLVGQVSNIGTLAFLLIAAATLFAGDYRWETWRLISARNSRFNLMAGKVMTLLALTLMASLGFLVAGTIVLTAAALFEGSTPAFSLEAKQGVDLGLLLLLGMARLVQVMVLSLLAATLTRSLMAALFVPIVVSIAQYFTEKFLMFVQIMPHDWQAIFLSPGLAVGHLKVGIDQGLPPALAQEIVTLSLASLCLWIAVPLALSFLLFQRQGMSKE